MNVLKRVFGRVRRMNGKRIAATVAVIATLTTVGVVGAGNLKSGQVAAADCSPNSIIKCGEPNRASLVARIKISPELQKIYADPRFGGFTAKDYDRFITSAKPGRAYRDNNTIVVDGKVVARNVGSIGRWPSSQGSGYTTFVVKGAGTYYGNVNAKSISAQSASLPVDVLFDASGKMQFAVMTSTCSNPTYGTPTTPPTCNELTAKNIGTNRWHFNTTINAGSNGESVNKVVYNFGDGTPAVTASQAPYAVEHIFTKASKVTATVYTNVPGGGISISSNCVKQIAFTPPPKPPTPPAAVVACTILNKTPGKIDATTGNQSYIMTAYATATNATVKSYNFSFDTGSTPLVVASTAKSQAVTHVYAPGTHHSSVTITFVTNTGVVKTVTGAKCAVPVAVKAPECKPGVPVGSPQCSTLACISLTPTPGAIDLTTGNQSYSFTAKASAENATITSYGFTFGDGSVVSTGSGATATTTHVFKPSATPYNTSVIVTGKDAAGRTIQTVATPNCATTVTVKTPECKPGVPTNSSECFTYTCDQFTVTQADDRIVTIGAFKATTTNPNASLKNVTIDWGDSTSDQLTSDKVVGSTHQFEADQSYTMTATAHFTASDNADIAVTGPSCVQQVAFTTTPPPVTPPVTPPTPPVVTPPTELPNTGAGNIVGIFGAVAVVSTITYRLFLSRRLNRQV